MTCEATKIYATEKALTNLSSIKKYAAAGAINLVDCDYVCNNVQPYIPEFKSGQDFMKHHDSGSIFDLKHF